MTSLRAKQVMRLPLRVWDAPTRLFHWAIVLLLPCSYITVKANWMGLHLLCGYTVLTLLLFRLAWGVVGSETARFSAFLKSPLAGLRHLARFRERSPDDQVGHNEAGGWMVLVMLALLLIQVSTGLLSNDDGATEGPLAEFVGKHASDRISGIHALNFKFIALFVALHVIAIIAYRVVKQHDLIRPMLTGKKLLPAATRAPRMAPTALAALVLAAAAAIVALVANAGS